MVNGFVVADWFGKDCERNEKTIFNMNENSKYKTIRGMHTIDSHSLVCLCVLVAG